MTAPTCTHTATGFAVPIQESLPPLNVLCSCAHLQFSLLLNEKAQKLRELSGAIERLEEENRAYKVAQEVGHGSLTQGLPDSREFLLVMWALHSTAGAGWDPQFCRQTTHNALAEGQVDVACGSTPVDGRSEQFVGSAMLCHECLWHSSSRKGTCDQYVGCV